MIYVREATGLVLDYLVAKAQGWVDYPTDSFGADRYWFTDPDKAPFCQYIEKRGYHPSKVWSQAGPLIERALIDLLYMGDGVSEHYWRAEAIGGYTASEGPTPLIAAMRCFVAYKLGDYAEIPKELM